MSDARPRNAKKQLRNRARCELMDRQSQQSRSGSRRMDRRRGEGGHIDDEKDVVTS